MKKRIAMIVVIVCMGVGMRFCATKLQNDIESVVSDNSVSGNEVYNTQQSVSDNAMVEGTEIIEAVSKPVAAWSNLNVAGVEAVLERMSVMTEESAEETEVEQEHTDTSQEEAESEYADLAIADVTNYVNVRSQPSTDGEIVGKIFDGAVAHILSVAGEEEEWFRITSGNVEGYIKSEFFIYGDDAVAVIDEYVIRYAKVLADRLNVRKGPSTEESRIGYIDNGEKVKVLENCGEWLRVQYTDQKEGYVSAEYVTVMEEFSYAKTLEEEQAEIAARRALEERQNASEESVPEMITDIVFPANNYGSNEELRKGIVDYALQFVGNKYVNGGSSLTTGTDCSGFTCFIYADFGYSISRTPSGQYSGAGRSIDYSEIQPGDIICYSSNGGASCTHVALYIGDGKIVHAANSRKGVITSNADWEPIIGIRNVID